MNTTHETSIDALARSLAGGVSRRSVLKGIVGGVSALALGVSWRERSVSAAPAGGIVYQFYQALAARDYKTAYSYYGGAMAQAHPYNTWVQGYADTAYVELHVSGTTSIPAKNQIKYTVLLTAWQADDSILRFSGNYVEGREGGVPKIISGSLAPASTAGIAPLCHVSNMSVSATSDAGAGQRYSTVTAVNNGGKCVMGALPGVHIYNSKHHELVTGKLEAGLPITTVTLASGERAKLDMHWSNWCGAKISGQITTKVNLPLAHGSFSGQLGPGVPPCLGAAGSASSLTFKPWVKA